MGELKMNEVCGTEFEKSKKVVIAGSANLKNEINKWIQYWNRLPKHLVIDFPNNFDNLYSNIYKKFFINIIQTDILFIMNEDKNDIPGYIGAETFAEMSFTVVQNLLYNKKIKIILMKMPSEKVHCFDEIVLWKRLGWIYEIKGNQNYVKKVKAQ